MILVSVIMPVYNAGSREDLDVAIRSILDQSIRELELIICDDCSVDETPERLCVWAKRDPRIVLIRSEKNLRAGGARNRAIASARGKYIALMDSDDYSYPNRLSEQVEYLENNPDVDFVGCRGGHFRAVPGDMEKTYWFVKAPQKNDFLMTLPFVHASLMFRSEVIEQSGGYRQNKWVIRSEDYDLLMRLYAAGRKGVNLDKTLYAIRTNEVTYKRRKYRYRINECFVKFSGFSKLGLMPKGIAYALKPLIVGLIPVRLLEFLKKKYYK